MELTICIIEDDLVSRFASVYSLEQANLNCRILTCNSAAEGLELFSTRLNDKKTLPDIIFLDLVMPEMDGWEFLDQLKRNFNNLQKTDIYILSAFANSKDRERAKHHPMIRGYFDKPLSKSILDKIFSPKLY